MSRTVVVIGGGLAGITAALDCAEAGAEVVLLESRGRLGGAAYSFVRSGLSVGELTVDNGQHVFLRCCTAYRELLARLGADALVSLQPRLEVPVLAAGGMSGRLARSGLPAPLHLAGSLLRYPFLGWRQRLAVAWAMQQLRGVDIDDPVADQLRFGDWLRRQRQSPAAIEAIWGLITRPTVNLTVDDASLAQAAQVFQVGLLQDPAAGDIGWSAAPLSELHDVAARRALERAGVSVHLRSTAREVVVEGRGICVRADESLTADAVVLALPHERTAALLPAGSGLAPGFSTRLGRSAIVNLHVVYDRPVLERPFAAGVGTPVQWIFDRSVSSGLRQADGPAAGGQYLAVSLSAADDELHTSAPELRERYLPALASLLPAARGAEVHDFFVTREHSATFRAAPGARASRPGPRTAIPGLVLAGAWTDTGWPATMEGAVRSGHAAAREALAAVAATAPRADRVEVLG